MSNPTKPSAPVEDTGVSEDINCDTRGCFRRLVPDDADTSKRETSECRECGAMFYADLSSL